MTPRRPPSGPGRPVRRASGGAGGAAGAGAGGATAVASRPAPEPGSAPPPGRARGRRRLLVRLLRTRAGLAVVVTVALLAGLLYAALGTGLLGVRAIDVRGTTSLSAAAVRAAVRVPLGYPLPRVDPAAVERRVEAVPAVRRVTVERVWPRTLRVTVVERTAVAVVADGSGWAYVDASGAAYAKARAPDGSRGSLPVIRTRRGDGGALHSAAAVVGVLPKALRARVATVDAQSEDSVVLRLQRKGSVVWGSPERSADKARVLAVLMKAEKSATVYDVSAPDAPTVR